MEKKSKSIFKVPNYLEASIMWIKLINRACQTISLQTLLTIFWGEVIKLKFFDKQLASNNHFNEYFITCQKSLQFIPSGSLLPIFPYKAVHNLAKKLLTCPSTLMTGISKQAFQLYNQVVPEKWDKRIRIHILSLSNYLRVQSQLIWLFSSRELIPAE